jgi:hypothetical protein
MRQIWITKSSPRLSFSPSGKRPIPSPSQAKCAFASKRPASISQTSWAAWGPAVPGYEVSGRIDAAGAVVDTSWVSREVLAMTRFGGYADVICVDEAADAHHFIQGRKTSAKFFQCPGSR